MNKPAPSCVSVALAVHRADERFAPALRSVLMQDGVELEVLIVLNGADDRTAALVKAQAARDPRCHVIELSRANLAAALNVALRRAAHPLVARMDADDLSLPGRLATQARVMAERSDLAALGTAFEVVDDSGAGVRVIAPAQDPADARWRLLIENEFCHGSMMLRRDAVLDAGGYNEAFERAQDFELWRRLAQRLAIAAIPDVLYRWRQSRGGAYASGPLQAERAAELLTAGWSDLPEGDMAGVRRSVDEFLSGRLHVRGLRDALEADLRREPSRSALTAWLWTWRLFPDMPNRALAAMRKVTLERALSGLAPCEAVHVLGLDERSRWVADLCGVLGHPAHAVSLERANALETASALLLASDWSQDQDWAVTAPLRARGVRVIRLYRSE